MALMSCGPAFMALVAESFADAGAAPRARSPTTRCGMTVETMAGTAAYLREHDYDTRGAAAARGHAGRRHRARPDRRSSERGLRGRLPGGRRRGRGGDALMSLCWPRSRATTWPTTSARWSLVYLVLIFIRIILSWIPRIPYNRWLNAVLKFVTDVTDPYLNLFRRFLPPVRLGPGRARPQPDRGHVRADHRERHRRRPDPRG